MKVRKKDNQKQKKIDPDKVFNDYKGHSPTEESVFLSSVVFVFSVFNFLLWGIIKGHSPFIVFVIDFAVNYT